MASRSFPHIAEEALSRTEKILLRFFDPDETDTPADDDSTAADHFWSHRRYKLSFLYNSFYAFANPLRLALLAALYTRTVFVYFIITLFLFTVNRFLSVPLIYYRKICLTFLKIINIILFERVANQRKSSFATRFSMCG